MTSESQFPVDPQAITGVRIDGSPGVTPVDSGTARVLVAAGETWLHWEHNGVRHAVNTRHIAELLSSRSRRTVVDLTQPKSELTRRLSAAKVSAGG